MNRYIFYIPEFNDISNGICLLWEAAYQFSKLKDVVVIAYEYGNKSELPSKYKSLTIKSINIEIFKEDIIIYPEGVRGNPLNGTKVCRYLMAKPYILNGEGVDYHEDDFVFAYSNATQILVPQYNICNENFLELIKWNDSKKIKGKITIYYGKCRITSNYKHVIDAIKNSKEIYIATRKHPNKKEKLYSEIASSELLISLDPLTSVIYESTLLGTPVIVADKVFKELYDQYNHKLYGLYYDYPEYLNSVNENLRFQVQETYIQELKSNNVKTIKIINEIENNFLNKNLKKIPKIELERKDLEFYINNWEMSPILNVTNFKSILVFHMISNYKILTSILLTTVITFRKIMKYCKNKINILIMKSVHPLAYEMLLQRKKKNKMIEKMNILSRERIDQDSTSINVSKKILLKIWSI